MFDGLMIVRVAGLPMRTLEIFQAGGCFDEIERGSALDLEMRAARDQLVDQLFKVIHEAPLALRGLLLTVKRDCFNGRSLKRHARNPLWSEISILLSPLLEQVVQLEESQEDWKSKFEYAYNEERQRQRNYLISILANPQFRRGIALASPDLLDNVDRLKDADEGQDRRRRKLELSLARYVSRAALKLSPFSTLTRVGLGKISCGTAFEATGYRFVGDEWMERSLVRVRRHPLNRICELLTRHPAFRAGLEVVLNNTAELIGSDRYRFLRPGHWRIDLEAREYQFVQDAVVRVNLSGSIIAWLVEQLSRQRMKFVSLEKGLCRKFPAAEPLKIQGLLGDLLQVGFLQTLMPWPANASVLESELIRYLRTLPQEFPQRDLLARLEEIERLKWDYLTSPTPEKCLAEVGRLLQELWDLTWTSTGLGEEVKGYWMRGHNLNEDVLLLRAPSGQQEVFEIAASKADEIRRAADPLIRISNIYNPQYDFLHTLMEFAHRRWPSRSEIGFLELFSEVQEIWREYMNFNATLNSESSPVSFNPLNIIAIEHLQEMRVRLFEGMAECMFELGDEIVIRESGMRSLAEEVKNPYLLTLGPCFFLQPADLLGEMWVLNQLLDGGGRYSSRYTPLLWGKGDPDFCAAPAGNERPELVDLMCCCQPDNLNMHRPQTARVLEVPGVVADLPSSRRLSLKDLRVLLSGSLPQLADSAGKHLLPIHLSPITLRLMPQIVRFLAIFGPGEFKLIRPSRRPDTQGDTRVFKRMRIGNIILRRRRWTVALAPLREELKGLTEVQSYVAVQRWRIARGIPPEVFLQERISVKFFGSDVYKPQYVDLTSPILVKIIYSILQTDASHLSLDEVLPNSKCLPRDTQGQAWAFEVQLESRSLDGLLTHGNVQLCPFVTSDEGHF